MESFWVFLGRLHLIVLHLPIGILLLAFMLEIYARWQKPLWWPAVRICLGLGAGFAVLSAVFGYILSLEGGYDPTLLQQHQWLGIGAAVLSCLSFLLYQKPVGFWFLGATVLVLMAAGHQGGSLTHGSDFLWSKPESTSNNTELAFAARPDSNENAYTALVLPILKSKCMRCHRSDKRKGGLSMESIATMLEGGKHGAALKPGNDAQSLMLQRIALPISAEDHMPPKGSTQITEAEIAILRAWIAQGASENTRVWEVTPSGFFNAEVKPPNPVWNLKVPIPSAKNLQKLSDLGIRADKLGENSPFLSISIPADPKLDETKIKSLLPLAQQIVALDVAGSRFTDALAVYLAQFPNLIRLNLARTPIQDAALNNIKLCKNLEYLNLTETAISDAGLQMLEKKSLLQHIYLWKTAVTPNGTSMLQQKYPKLHIEGSAPDDNSQLLALRTPKILYAHNFFKDTVHVALDFPLKTVGLYYTLNQASPTTQSARYQQPLVFNETTTLKAIAAKEGWLPSPVAEISFIKRSKTPQHVALMKPPSPQYPALGAASLSDGKISDVQGGDTWLGYQGDNLTAVFDFGALQSFQNAYVHCLENNAPWIFSPRRICIWASTDGKKYLPCGAKSFTPNASMGNLKVQLLSIPFDQPVQARYFKILVENLGKNPSWHPNKGEPCWIFVDEVIIE